MTLWDDLDKEVGAIFQSRWDQRDGTVVPAPENLRLGNGAVKLSASVLYADMIGSTKLVDEKSGQFAAEVYKAFLTCAARTVKSNGGAITAYDGDRIMAVFIGDMKNTRAVTAALNINHTMTNIVRKRLAAQYPNVGFEPRHVVGVDTSDVLVARVGVRNDNDLVWVGRAANHAAKLCDIREPGDYATYITDAVFESMHAQVKVWRDGRAMWEARTWTSQGGVRIHRSNWWVSSFD